MNHAEGKNIDIVFSSEDLTDLERDFFDYILLC